MTDAPELHARIAAKDTIDVVGSDGTIVANISGQQCAALGKSFLCAGEAVVGGEPRPQSGRIIRDAHLPVMKWSVGRAVASGEPVLTVTLPSGVEMTLQIRGPASVAIGKALIAAGEAASPPAGHRPN
jgi:hypothetical protein